MKVLIGTHAYSGNGAAIMLLSVISHWVRELGWTVDTLLELDRDVPNELVATGANAFPTANPKDYDFALVNTLVSAHYLQMLAPHTPTILWVHEGESVLWNSNLTASQWRELFRLPSRIIFQSRWQTDSVFKSFLLGLNPQSIRCVPNGLPELPKDLSPKPRLHRKRRIVCLGGVYGRKRPQDLIDAILELGRDDLECVFVGTTDALQTIGKDHIDKLTNHPALFKLVGDVDRKQAIEYLMSADLFVLPSGDESQPIAPLEAASLDIPCALTDLPPYVGVWRHGENCLLSPVADVPLLGRNIATLLEDGRIRQTIITSGREVAKRFGIRAFWQRFDADVLY